MKRIPATIAIIAMAAVGTLASVPRTCPEPDGRTAGPRSAGNDSDGWKGMHRPGDINLVEATLEPPQVVVVNVVVAGLSSRTGRRCLDRLPRLLSGLCV
jgi:hypothetical protein